MKIDEAKLIETPLGLSYQDENVSLLFGNRHSGVEAIQNDFPNLKTQRIKQTHSDIIVPASDQVVEADAHFSNSPQKALLISTADCLPVFIYCHQTKRIASIHAGWKGVANLIVLKTLKQLIVMGSSKKHFEIWIGPHILQDSFEIDSDVLQNLRSASYSVPENEIFYEKNKKFYVDLNRIVYSQIASVSGDLVNVWNVSIDTKTNMNYWSFRRDHEKAGRNISFISLK